MTDIVERLRGFRPPVSGAEICGEAADEIERLRAAATTLLAAMDNMHERGETFTGGVSIAAAAMRQALDHGLPTAEDVRGIIPRDQA
jgi:hypothetical protein